MTTDDKRFYVYDRKVGPLTTISAINPRYWVVDRTTGQRVDELSSKRAADQTARDLNRAESTEAGERDSLSPDARSLYDAAIAAGACHEDAMDAAE